MPPQGSGHPAPRRLWFCCALAAASISLAIVISGVFANARVWADDATGRLDCGTVWEASASTSSCATALEQRAWVTVALLGVAVFGALVAVVLAGGEGPARRRIAAVAVLVAVLVVAGGAFWGGVIDRGTGP